MRILSSMTMRAHPISAQQQSVLLLLQLPVPSAWKWLRHSEGITQPTRHARAAAQPHRMDDSGTTTPHGRLRHIYNLVDDSGTTTPHGRLRHIYNLVDDCGTTV
jgi:hypothetical protein